MNKVFFPRHQEKIKYSDQLIDFFNLNAIKTNDEYFDLELLRKLSKSDIELFYRLKLELELKGFNFGVTNGFFEHDIDYDNYKYLYTENESSFSPFELQKLGLWEVISGMNKYEKNFYNYSPLERFISYAKYQSNFEELLNRSGYKIINVKPPAEIKDEGKIEDNNVPLNLDSISNVFISKKIIKALSDMRRVSPELKIFLINNGLKTVGDMITVMSINIDQMLSRYNNQHDYTLNILSRILSELKAYLNEVKANYNLKEDTLKSFLFNADFARNFYNEGQIKSEFIYFDKDNIIKYNYEFLNIVGLYENEVSLLKNLNLVELTSIFNINDQTNIDYYCSKEYEFIDHYYNFYSLIEKIYGELSDCCEQHPIHAEENLQALYILPDIEAYLKNIKLGNNKHTLDILRYRDKGITLQEAGTKYNITRERVRQIQKKFVSNNTRYIHSLIKNIISKYNYLPMEVLYSYPGFITTIADSNILEFDAMVGIFLHDNLLNVINKQLDEWNPVIIDSEVIIEEIKNKTQVELWYSFDKIQKGKITIPNRSLREVGEEYLLTKGTLGWEINEDTEEIIEFFSKYNKKVSGKRNIIAYVTNNDAAILYNLGKYIHRDNIDSKHVDAMKTVISNVNFSEYGNNAKDIFEENKTYLIENGILNYYYLYGLTRKFYKERKLVFTGRSLRIGLEETLDPVQNIIVSYLKENNNIANVKTLKTKLSIDDVTIQQSRSIYKLDANTVVTEDFFSMNEIEEEKILSSIEKYISLQGYCHTQNIIDDLYFDTEVNSFFKRNKIGKNQNRLIYTLNYYFNELYSFSIRNSAVVPLGIEIKSYSDLIELHFKDKTFSMEELKDRFNYLKIKSSITQSSIINNNIIKLDKNQYMFKNDFNIESINISILDDIMMRYFADKTIVFSKEIIRRLKQHDLLEELWNKEELLATLITESDLNWQKITINVFTNAFSNSEVMLYNNLGNSREIMIGEVLIDFIYEKNKGYLTIDDINQILLDYEIITSKLPNGILLDIFSEYNMGGLIRVVRNES